MVIRIVPIYLAKIDKLLLKMLTLLNLGAIALASEAVRAVS